jgi:SAM-dependent methyltransferase
VLRARQVDENRRYRLADDYVSRAVVEAHDDTSFTDEWQDEVYSRARQLVDQNRLTSILDIGCGSGFKLMKYFSSLASVGAEISPTYEFLLQKYPERRWIRSDFSVPFAEPVDVVLAADVIEHLADPDALMRFISGINCKLIVLSTTARDLLGDGKGPPRNPCHAREWTADEFRAYVGSHFRVVEHGISNPAQAAQYVVCAPGSSAPRTGQSG